MKSTETTADRARREAFEAQVAADERSKADTARFLQRHQELHEHLKAQRAEDARRVAEAAARGAEYRDRYGNDLRRVELTQLRHAEKLAALGDAPDHAAYRAALDWKLAQLDGGDTAA